MKYWLAVIVLFAAVSVSAQTFPAFPELVPAPQEALTCGPWQQTPLDTVGGSTCLQAAHDLHGDLTNTANCLCGFCGQQFVDQPCRVIQGGYQVSGYLKYRCYICPE
jgi:hypothetical protein